MSVAASPPLAADRTAPGAERRGERLLVWLPVGAAPIVVAAYLATHRELVLAPGRELARVLAAGAWSPGYGVVASFALLLLPGALLLAALAAAIWPWTRLYDQRPTLRLLATAVVTSAVVVALQIALGSAGLLQPGPLAVVSLGGVLCLGLATRLHRRSRRPPGRRRPVAGPLSGGLTARWAARLDLAPPTRLGLALGSLTAAAWLALLVIAALVPPWGWDALVYHLADVFQFAQSGTLEPFGHPLHQFRFPKVAELHALWFYLLAGSGADAWRITGVALLPLALTAGVAVRAAAEVLGLRAALPWLAPAMMLTPLLLVQPVAGYIDLAFAAFALAAFAFLLAAVSRRRVADWAFAGLACGLALGTKPTFVYMGLPLLALLTARPLRALLDRRALAWLPLVAALLAAGCGYWLLPALLRTGNPFHPVAVKVAGRTLLDGPVMLDTNDSHRQRFVGSLAGWATYPFAERHRGEISYSPDNGFGPQFAGACVALPFALLLAFRQRRRLLLRALLMVPATLAVWLALSPWEHPRYALAACGMALLALAAIEEAVASGVASFPGARALLRTALVAALLFALPAGLLAAAPELPRVAAAWRGGNWSPQDYYPIAYGPAGSAFNWLSRNGGPETTVTFDRPIFVGPLFGWHGRNRVVYAASQADLGADGYLVAGSYRSWRRFLVREAVDWVVVWRPWWQEAARPSVRERWLGAHGDDFTELAAFGDAVRILAPLPGAAASAESGRPDTELSRAALWRLEYATGARASVTPDPSGGLRIDYRFLSPDPDYLDLRFDLEESDWPPAARLGFRLETPGGSPLLFVYLKEADPRRSCRFRIRERPPATESQQVWLDLARPERCSPDFRSRRVASVHLVLDDEAASRPSTGSFRIFDFRLETGGGERSPAPVGAQESPS